MNIIEQDAKIHSVAPKLRYCVCFDASRVKDRIFFERWLKWVCGAMQELPSTLNRPKKVSGQFLVPTLLLMGEQEVIYDAANALSRARRLIPNFEGKLVRDCSHEMTGRQHRIVDARVVDFLKGRGSAHTN